MLYLRKLGYPPNSILIKMVYQFIQEQHLPITIIEAWDFFSSPENLAEITPPQMGFQIMNGKPKPMYAGQIIQYTVKLVLGIPLTWVTEITQVNKPHFFVDEQRKGPYKIWHHQHHFVENDQGVLMEDIVTYEVPLGVLGQIANALFISKQLNQIFDYRKQYLEKKFATSTEL